MIISKTKEKIIQKTQKTNAEILVKIIEEQKIDTIFGYTGAVILPVFDALSKSTITTIINSNEQSATFSANGYSRSSNKTGIAIVTSGPGITNTLTAVTDAFTDSIPLIVIAGQVNSNKIGSDAFQFVDVPKIFESVSKKTFRLTNESNVEKEIRQAFIDARTGKPGPIVVDFPIDVQQKIVEFQTNDSIIENNGFEESGFEESGFEESGFEEKVFEENNSRQKIFTKNVFEEKEPSISINVFRKFFSLISSSKKPVLFVGGGTNNHLTSVELKKLNSKLNIPIVCSLMGKGVMDENNDSHLGMVGMFGTPSANTIIQETDLVIAIGARFDDRVIEKNSDFCFKPRIISINIDKKKVVELNKEKNIVLNIFSNALTFLKQANFFLTTQKKSPMFTSESSISFPLTNENSCFHGSREISDFTWAESETSTTNQQKPHALVRGVSHNFDYSFNFVDWTNHAIQTKKSFEFGWNTETNFIQQSQAIFELNKLLNEEDIIVTGVGNNQMFSAQLITRSKPRTFLTSGSFGVMGFALPTAIGAQKANPNKKIIVIDGDGSARMNLGELNTIPNQKIPIKIIILNNNVDGMVQNLQDFAYKKRFATQRPQQTNFASIAKALNFDFAKKIVFKKDLIPTLKTFLNSKNNALIEIITDPNEVLYPKIPANQPYSKMMLGPFIKQRFVVK